jgi:hypothetical protein
MEGYHLERCDSPEEALKYVPATVINGDFLRLLDAMKWPTWIYVEDEKPK